MKKKKVLYDATLVANAGLNNSDRSGIFIVAYNILLKFLEHPELSVSLYANPGAMITLKDVLSKEPFSKYNFEIINGSDAWRMGVWRNKCTSQKMSSKGLKRKIFKFLGLFFKVALILRYKYYHSKALAKKVHEYDAYFSPVHKVPDLVRNSGVKRYTFIHDTIPLLFPDFSPFIKWGYSWQAEMLYSLDENDYCFANSLQTKTDFLRFAPKLKPENVVVTPLAAANHFKYCVDNESIKTTKEKYGIPEGVKYVFSLCTLEPRKNLIFSVKNFVEFIQKNDISDIVFVLGGGSWDGFIKKLEDEIGTIADFQDKIIRIGYVEDNDLAPLFSGALCTIYASLYEGFGLPALEAMQCGCPVITSNLSSLPEVVGDAGIMIDPRSDKDAQQAFHQIYFDEKFRNELVSKGLERAKQFSWQKCSEIMINKMFKDKE